MELWQVYVVVAIVTAFLFVSAASGPAGVQYRRKNGPNMLVIHMLLAGAFWPLVLVAIMYDLRRNIKARKAMEAMLAEQQARADRINAEVARTPGGLEEAMKKQSGVIEGGEDGGSSRG